MDERTVKALIVDETNLTMGYRLAFRRQRDVRIPSLGICIGYSSEFKTVGVSRYVEPTPQTELERYEGTEQPRYISPHPAPDTQVIREIDFPASIAEQALALLRAREALQSHADFMQALTAMPK